MGLDTTTMQGSILRVSSRLHTRTFHGRYHAASSNYFRALGIPLLAGRYFDTSETKGVPPSWIIKQSRWPTVIGPMKMPWANELLSRTIRPQKTGSPLSESWGDVKDKPSSPGAEPAFWWALSQQSSNFSQVSLGRSVTGESKTARELYP